MWHKREGMEIGKGQKGWNSVREGKEKSFESRGIGGENGPLELLGGLRIGRAHV